MRATTEGAEIPRSGKRLPRRAIALGHSRRPCAGSRKHRRPRLSMVENRSRRRPRQYACNNPRGPKSRGPVTACPVAPSLSATLADRAPARASTADPVYRWSKIGRVARHANMRATTEGAEIPRSGNTPAPSRHRSRLLSQTVRRLAQAPPTPFIDGRKSVASPPTPICVQRPRGPKSRGPVTACPVAPSLSATLPDRAPARASTADPVYRWSKIGRVARPRQYACNDRGGRNPEVR